MRPLIIDDNVKYQIKNMIEYSHAHPLSLQDIKNTIAGTQKPIGDDLNHVIHLFHGYRIVYSEEHQPVGLCRHISVSVTGDEDTYPNPFAINEIIKEFGFKNQFPSENLKSWMEKDLRAINIIEVIDTGYVSP